VAKDRLDPETLAAFLDGKLAGAERERVVRILSTSSDDYATMVDAAAVMHEVGVPPRAVDRRPSRRTMWRLAAAAGIAGLALLPGLLEESAPEIRLLEEYGALNTDNAPLPRSWTELALPATRGGSSDGDGWEFRTGLRTTSMIAASKMRDTAAVRVFVSDLISELETRGGAASASVARLRDFDVSSPETIDDAASEIRAVFHGAWYDLGSWSGQARIAEMRGLTIFFNSGGNATAELEKVRNALAELPVRTAAGEEVIAVIDQILAAIAAGSTPQLQQRLSVLVSVAAR
jgi:hypothetical protein